ncbi:MAG: phosphoribosylanthranilate isomerase [Aequorivita sp.]|nr:phosphoribosylanthranilate isomerase [Aequorivita sp.]
MKHNIAEVAELEPDYLGFIFYEKSPRFFDGEITSLPSGTKKVGVFVDTSLKEIIEKIEKYDLDVVQLHGDESVNFCNQLKAKCQAELVEAQSIEKPVLSAVEVWKVFSIKDEFDFEILKPYEDVVDKFLFDTKGKEKGGNGYAFNWEILKKYPSKKPFILSGGIGLEKVDSLKKILKTDLPFHAIDVNSKFEIEPGLKNIKDLKKFKNEL